jgi:predicted glutamine amidotransferase
LHFKLEVAPVERRLLLSRLKSNGNVIGVAFMAQLDSFFMHEGVLTHHDEENQEGNPYARIDDVYILFKFITQSLYHDEPSHAIGNNGMCGRPLPLPLKM